ncbi:ral guanine nucleotide dissociation stimulator-like isoform X1 [Diceros bicornis minor]|uniref:ral guanine nucleotide dissociation stimulator-like isoform X1 n=1 Tax=Diceros bicornis minor TaxID=77932 RepID=UPI0026EFBBFF|nr:ral guanine nucleotide dissociation stimulator-like isoform X1 [Diceros bicornis minor]XP_058420468.1 ral guanine nucleotide dissociation stimulator-like isoform X1 [Diceros bicornis minor]
MPLGIWQEAAKALEPASPPSAVLELEQGPTSAAAGVGAAELESPGPSLLVGSPSPPVAIKEGEKKPNLTAFPPKLVAEQLTVMDAELFRKVVPSQCLGSTWGKRNKPGNEHLAPTVQATVDHFRRVVSLVVTTCLGDPSMAAQDRARVVEHWIQVAQECEILKNFSSLRAVISALQKTSISHLKNTWADVSWRRFVMQLLRLHLGLLPSCLCCLHTRLSSIPARTYVMLFQEEMSWRPQPLSGTLWPLFPEGVDLVDQGRVFISQAMGPSIWPQKTATLSVACQGDFWVCVVLKSMVSDIRQFTHSVMILLTCPKGLDGPEPIDFVAPWDGCVIFHSLVLWLCVMGAVNLSCWEL